ncbi:MAG: thioredoxin family protein [Armatimonadota bacterium]|nr:thioredoxin family protein [Armatimonadota bacterium]MDR7485449.1 thioredoxin family protein [Armatimonadota bacterium]MDR7534368.1 thioredoxin family protein [Armatimonadota bacterium]MDR7536833.1 thioredoxin family protein [Armatimonadota bacterium]
MNWQQAWDRGLPYAEFLVRHGEERHRERWQRIYDQVALDGSQQALLAGFTRRMHLLCVAGVWCGDCVLQGPVLQRIAEASPAIALRFLDRDAHADVQDALVLNAGRRIPVVVFLAEDFEECGRYGDRTLSVYRRLARDRLGPSCPTGIVPPDDQYLPAVVADWLNEVERVQLMLRLSPRLRARHGD